MTQTTVQKGAVPVFSAGHLNPSVVLTAPPGWHPRIFCTNLSPYWRHVRGPDGDLAVDGMSYMLFPAPTAPHHCSAFFDPASPYFHTAAGAYVLGPVQGERVPPQVVGELGAADYLAWLMRFQDPDPACSLLRCEVREAGEGRWSVDYSYRSHLALGRRMPQHGQPRMFTVPPQPASAHGESAPPEDYADFVATAPGGTVWYHGDHLIYAWYFGARFTTRSGRTVDTFHDQPQVVSEMRSIAASVRVVDRMTGLIMPPAYLPEQPE